MQYNIVQSKGKTFSSVSKGYETFLVNGFAQSSLNDIIYIASDGNELANIASLLEYINPKLKILRFPAWDTVPYDRVSPNPAIIATRIECLSELALNPVSKTPRIIITSVGAVLQRLPLKKIFLNSTREVVVGSRLNFNDFIHYLSINGYTKVAQVYEQGEYAVRGDIIDIFPVGTDEPLRIDLFDDEVERIRKFDVMSQRTTSELKSYTFKVMSEVVLDANTIKTFRSKYREAFGADFSGDEIYEAVSNNMKYIGIENWLPFFYDEPLPTIFDYLPNASIIISDKVNDAATAKADSIADYYQARLEALKIKSASDIEPYRPVLPQLLYLTDKEFVEILDQKQAITVTSMNIPSSDTVIDTQIIPVRNFSSAKNIAASKVYTELKGDTIKFEFVCYGNTDDLEWSAKKPTDDMTLFGGEHVELLIAPRGENDGGRYYHLALNPAGSLYDAKYRDTDWGMIGNTKTEIKKDRWIASFELKHMAFTLDKTGATGSEWNINFCRTIKKKGKEAEHSSWTGSSDFHSIPTMGLLQFSGSEPTDHLRIFKCAQDKNGNLELEIGKTGKEYLPEGALCFPTIGYNLFSGIQYCEMNGSSVWFMIFAFKQTFIL